MTRTAFIIEDDALIASELEGIVEALGFRVLGTAATEDEAVGAATSRRPDLLLVDVRLARGDGISAVERILPDHDGARVVYVTGNRDEVGRRAAGAICVNKPFNRQMIERAIRSAFAGPGGSDPPGGLGSASGAGPRDGSARPAGRPPGRPTRLPCPSPRPTGRGDGRAPPPPVLARGPLGSQPGP